MIEIVIWGLTRHLTPVLTLLISVTHLFVVR